MNEDLAAARDELTKIVSEYGAYKNYETTVVFDAPNTDGREEINIDSRCRVVFTKKGETADSFIERITYELSKEKRRVFVVSSDSDVESIILGAGGFRVPSREFMDDIKQAKKKLRNRYLSAVTIPLSRHDVSTRIDKKTLDALDKMRHEL